MSIGIDFWRERVSESADEHGVAMTAEQIDAMAHDMELAREGYGEGEFMPADPRDAEIADLSARLTVERSKVTCGACRGRGMLVENFGTFTSRSQCDRCHGEGRVAA